MQAISQPGRSGHRSHVENDSASRRLHPSDYSIDTVEIAFDVNAKNTVEVVLGRTLDRTNVRDASIIYKDVNPTLLRNCLECRSN